MILHDGCPFYMSRSQETLLMDRCKMAGKGRKNKDEVLKFSFEARIIPSLECSVLDPPKCSTVAASHQECCLGVAWGSKASVGFGKID